MIVYIELEGSVQFSDESTWYVHGRVRLFQHVETPSTLPHVETPYTTLPHSYVDSSPPEPNCRPASTRLAHWLRFNYLIDIWPTMYSLNGSTVITLVLILPWSVLIPVLTLCTITAAVFSERSRAAAMYSGNDHQNNVLQCSLVTMLN